MKYLALLLLVAAPVHAQSQWAGKLDKTGMPYAAAYQSFTSATQALGFEKRIVSLDYKDQEMVKLGVFLGATSSLGQSPKVVGGPTFAVPGSLLDFALGTTWGQQWLPKLKTGVAVGWDIVRPSQMQAKPSFVGFGISYPVGNP